jgi:methanogenic corrinoid protein MtbC1
VTDRDAGGLSAGSAAAADTREAFRQVLRRTVEGDLLPRLLLQHRAGPVPPSLAIRVGVVDEAELDRFMELLRSPDDLRTDRYLRDRFESGGEMPSIFQDLLAPAAHRLGRMWEDDTCDFVEVTLACARIQRAVRRLSTHYRAVGPSRTLGRVLVCGVAGDQHTLGAVLVAETLAREGFSVHLGPPFEKTVPEGPLEFVAVSVANSDRWLETRARIEGLRRVHPEARILLGGAAVARNPAMAISVGADEWALDVDGLLRIVRRRGDH